MIEAAEQALARGVRALVVISAGFAETGSEGIDRQERLLALVRAHGARLIGPNCLGISVAGPSLNATFASRSTPPGHDRLLVAERRARARAARGCRHARPRPLRVRLDREQGGRLDERPARVVGGRRRRPRRSCSTSSRSGTRAGSAASLAGSRGASRSSRSRAGARRAASAPRARTRPRSQAPTPLPTRCSGRPASSARRRSRSWSTSPRCSRPAAGSTGRSVGIVTNAGGLGSSAPTHARPPASSFRRSARTPLPALSASASGGGERREPRRHARQARPPTRTRRLCRTCSPTRTSPRASSSSCRPSARRRTRSPARSSTRRRARVSDKPVLAVVMTSEGTPAALRGTHRASRRSPIRSPPRARSAASPTARPGCGARRARCRRSTGIDRARAEAVVEAALARSDDAWLDPAATRELLEAYGLPLVPERVAASVDEAVAAARGARLPGRRQDRGARRAQDGDRRDRARPRGRRGRRGGGCAHRAAGDRPADARGRRRAPRRRRPGSRLRPARRVRPRRRLRRADRRGGVPHRAAHGRRRRGARRRRQGRPPRRRASAARPPPTGRRSSTSSCAWPASARTCRRSPSST